MGGWAVPVNNADLITVVQCEALFLECGGYRSSSSRWRPALLLEDSPSCPRGTSGCGCSEQSCPWLAFVALKHQRNEIPCRQIVVGKHGETIEILYRTATPVEFEESFHTWLIETIDRLEHLAAQADEERKQGGCMEFVCKGCGKRKGAADEWLLVFEFVKPDTDVKNMIFLAEWDDKRALDPRATHFCSLACQKGYVAKYYARELAAT